MGLALRKAKYEVVMMEEYAATDATVEFACQGDVMSCDVYVGLFAWRYGYIPEQDNPAGKSITELEYLAASNKIPRLIFLLKDSARWPNKKKDKDIGQISELRERLKTHRAAYFSNQNELAVEVLAALRVLECTQVAQPIEAIEVIQQGQELGPSFLMNIREQLGGFHQSPLVEIQIGPTPWWNTRLYLVAALAEEIGGTEHLVFVDAKRQFITMAPPVEIRQRLAQRWPKLEQAYSRFRLDCQSLSAVEENLWRYPMAVTAAFGDEELSVKEIVTVPHLDHDLGIKPTGTSIEMTKNGQVFLQRQIVRHTTPYVALIRDNRLDGFVNTQKLARKVADRALAHFS